MSERMQTITVRLSPSHVRALEARAKARKLGTAPYLRGLVVDLLEGANGEEQQQTMEKLVRAVDDLRHRLAKATAAILADLQTTTKEDKGKKLTAEYIQTWVGRNILG